MGDSFLHCQLGCQQALEKLLKGIIVATTRQMPLRVHNLVRLAALAGLTLYAEQEKLLSQLSLQYVELRYPDELEAIGEINRFETAELCLQQTQEIFR